MRALTQHPISTRAHATGLDPEAGTARAWPALIETTKPGITRLVTITALFGFAIEALASRELTLAEFVFRALVVAVGAALTSGGANALNMWMESERDARMERTASRPIPAGTLQPNTVLAWGLLLAAVGVVILLVLAGPAAGLAALAGVALYVLVYTPLKTRTVWNTLVGAVPGAVPPLIGAAAATTALGFEPLTRPVGWSLFALMLVWQIPHFLAIAWMYRSQYAAAGHRMLPAIDRTGAATAISVVATAAVLVAASLLPLLAGVGGWVYGAVAVATGLAYLAMSVRLARRRNDTEARKVFFASIAHLPVLMLVLLAETTVRTLAFA